MKPFLNNRYVVVILVMALAGLLSYPVERNVWKELEADQPSLQLGSVEEALGQGVLIGMFGGFRTILADLLWLQGNFYWENYNIPATTTVINLTTTVDPRPMFFWMNGARMIGYDMPVWRIKEMGDFENVPEPVIARVQSEQGERAIELLDRAARYHPDNPAIFIEKGTFYREKIKDLDKSAEMYRLAAELPDAPAYAARIHAEMLKQAGRNYEAYVYLRKLYPTLSDSDTRDRKDVVLERIIELEQELEIPLEQRFRLDLDPRNS